MSSNEFFDPSMIVLWGLVALLAGITVWKKGKGGIAAGLRSSWEMFRQIMCVIPFAMLVAYMLAEVLPSELIGGWLGEGSGVLGLVIASFSGAFVPSGPFVSFPIAITLLHSGAGVPQLVAFVTGWALLAVHRVLALELPLMGARFVAVRLGVSIGLPTIAGATAYVLWPYLAQL
ncbi:MAG: hypothetical protein ACKVK8_04865 [Rhodospirillales bacterium]|jgi:uncharacterized membrane protein YraQ (UPF0718 family)